MGAIRTPELDGKAFIQANSEHGSANEEVTLAQLLANVQKLWTEVISTVGSQWFYLDARNAEEGGNWAGYGDAVDAIRFPYPREVEVQFDEHGNAKPVATSSERQVQALERFPPAQERHQPVPDTYPLAAQQLSNNVLQVGQRDGNGIGFMFWKKENKKYVGHFANGKRAGKGVMCCRGENMFDQEWSEKDTNPLALDPVSSAPIKERADLEVVIDIPGVEFLGSLKLEGLVAVRWTDNGDVFVGMMSNGKRLGKGVFVDGKTGVAETQEWKQGDDNTDWWSLMDFEDE
jgi:hypothetical protein